MSATERRIWFTAVVADSDHWPQADRAAAEAACDDPDTDLGTCDDWVARRLEEVMRQAGQRFIDENPHLFKLKELFP